MATGRDVVYGAFSHLGITDVSAEELSDGLEKMNDMLTAWELSLKLGFSPLSDAANKLRVPRNAIGAIKAHLAILIAPGMGKAVPDALAVMARRMYNDLLIANIDLEVAFPSTLPMGSGNTTQSSSDADFFPENTPDNF